LIDCVQTIAVAPNLRNWRYQATMNFEVSFEASKEKASSINRIFGIVRGNLSIAC